MIEANNILSNEIKKAVTDIKSAILQSQRKVARNANAELLSLYYGIGKYVSEHTRTNTWGTNAIETISQQLVRELPGLRGFSATAIKRMRIFYEQWSSELNRPLSVDDLQHAEDGPDTTILANRPLLVNDLDVHEFCTPCLFARKVNKELNRCLTFFLYCLLSVEDN